MTIYIVVYAHEIIESVWDTHEAAEKAVLKYKDEAGGSVGNYRIIRRQLNKLKETNANNG